MNVGEFFITLGVNPETAKIKDFLKAVGELPIEAAGALAALGGITFEFKRIAEESLNAAVGFEAFTSQTGLSSQELQRWQIVAQQANVSTSAVAASVEGLQRNLAEIRLGRGDIAPYQLLQLDSTQNAFGVLEQLRQRIKGLDRATATNLVARMGISPEMMNVLTLPEERFRQFSRTVRGQTEEQTKAFLKAKLALTQFSLGIQDLGMNFFYNLITIIGTVVDHIHSFQGGMLTLAGIITTVLIAISPLTAALTLLALIIEDIAVYFMGGKSLTGHFIEGLKTIFDDPIESAKVFIQLIDQLIEKLTGGEGIKTAVKQFMNLPGDIVEGISSGDFTALKEDIFGGDSMGRYGKDEGGEGPRASPARSMREYVSGGRQQNPYGNPWEPAMAVLSPSVQNKTTNIYQKSDIRIDGAESPRDTAEAVDRHLKSQVNAATLQLDNQGH